MSMRQNFNTPTVKANIETIRRKNTTISAHSKENLSHSHTIDDLILSCAFELKEPHKFCKDIHFYTISIL